MSRLVGAPRTSIITIKIITIITITIIIIIKNRSDEKGELAQGSASATRLCYPLNPRHLFYSLDEAGESYLFQVWGYNNV